MVLRCLGAYTFVTPMRDIYMVFRFTRHWIHYGFLTHVVVCVVASAIKGVLES